MRDAWNILEGLSQACIPSNPMVSEESCQERSAAPSQTEPVRIDVTNFASIVEREPFYSAQIEKSFNLGAKNAAFG